MAWDPGYLELSRNGELEGRVAALMARMDPCTVCPRRCQVHRSRGREGHCRSGVLPVVSSFCVHRGEEPALVGTGGVGNVFLGNCNLRCVYCQNHEISQRPAVERAKEATTGVLGDILLDLQARGCGRLGFVSPTHFAPQVVAAIASAVPRGLRLPLIWNSNGYDDLAILRHLEGITEIFLPDLRYATESVGRGLSEVPDYPRVARAAIREMARQVGTRLLLDDGGQVLRGLVIRILVLPGLVDEALANLRWIADTLGTRVTVSVMSQYYPAHRAMEHPDLCRPIRQDEYQRVVQTLYELEFENGWVQDLEARDCWQPDFSDREAPFVDAYKAPSACGGSSTSMP